MIKVMELLTPLGNGGLLFHAMQTEEELGRLYNYNIEALSTNANIDSDKLIGKPITVQLELPQSGTRSFNGYVTSFSFIGMEGRYYKYRLIACPWLWFLMRSSDCRIFQNKTIVDIIKDIFSDYPQAKFEIELTEKYTTREYCVQYRESDFNFISRLMEEEGIYYYFKHEADHHTLVLADSPSAHHSYAGYESLPYLPQQAMRRSEEERISDWRYIRNLRSGRYVHDHYDFQKPSVELQSRSGIKRDHVYEGFEQYDYSGRYLERGLGEKLARIRSEEEQTLYETIEGTSNARGISTGYFFKLIKHPRNDQNIEYLITSTQHTLKYGSYETSDVAPEYTCTFTLINSRYHYRSQRLSKKTFVQGPHTAVVVGPSGDEIHTDQHGRVKVQFHWDRLGQKNEHSSCWIRVANPLAGSRFGFVALPRIGQEVVVDFLEGDPDQPLIVSRVFNAEQMPNAFSATGELPSNLALAGFKSKELKGTSYNELLFDDTQSELRVKLSSEHAKTQLNLGYLTHPRNGGKADPRGEGFELRTDAAGALRAEKGLFLSADGRTQAVGGQLSREELVSCLEEALNIAKSLSQQATTNQADTSDLSAQQTLKQAAKDWGHGSNAEKDKANGGQPIIAASAPAGIAFTTPKNITTFTGNNTDVIAQKNFQTTSGQQTFIHAGTGISQYADSGDIKSIANRGKYLIQAQHNDVVINAEQNVQVTASQQGILVNAAQHITLICGGAYIKIANGNIEFGCNQYTVKAANYSFVGPASMNEALPQFKQGDVGRKFQFNRRSDQGAASDMDYHLTKSDGSQMQNKMDNSGATSLEKHDTHQIHQVEVPDNEP